MLVVYDNMLVLYGNMLVLYGNMLVLYCNTLVLYSNILVLYGNMLVLYGNILVLYGNMLLLYGNILVLYGNQASARPPMRGGLSQGKIQKPPLPFDKFRGGGARPPLTKIQGGPQIAMCVNSNVILFCVFSN